ncbi:MAG: hypothetical protein Q8R40_01315 [bacterium]|nr:hypothetical protein [bacterium]
MTTQILIKKLNKEVAGLKGEIREMKKFLFSPLKDSEGEYRESFVKKIRARSQSQGLFQSFGDKESFLNHVRAKK